MITATLDEVDDDTYDDRETTAARLWSRLHLPLPVAAVGAVVALIGSYLFWTMETVRINGVPLTGNLYDYGIGGPRIYSVLLGLTALVHSGMLVVARPAGSEGTRSGRRTSTSAAALARLGAALAGIPLGWAITLVVFEKKDVTVVGPGAWTVLAGGLLVWLGARSLHSAPAGPTAHPWPRRSLGMDVAVLLGVMVLGFVVFLCGVGTAKPGTVLAFFSATDATSFIGYLIALVGLVSWIGLLGMRTWLSGPFQRLQPLAFAVMALLILYFPFTQQGNTFWIRVSAQAAIFVIAALGLNIVVGSAGLLDLGYVAFVAIGAYVAAFTGNALLTNVNFHLPFILVLLVVAPVVAAVFGVLLGAPTLRLRGDYLAIVTLGFGEIVRIVLNNSDRITRGPNGISSIPDPAIGGWHMQQGLTILGVDLPGDAAYLYLALVVILGVLAIVRRVNDSRIGRAWVAIREDEVAAASMGINTTVLKLLAFAAGAFFAGMAGSINAHLGTQVSPDSYTFDVSVLILAMVVLGGIGNPAGVALGAVILTFLPEKLRDFSDVRFLVFGVALVLIMRFRPEGLLPSARRRRELHASGPAAAAESEQLIDLRHGA